MAKHYVTSGPSCSFVEAVVAGYSPIDKWTCHFARVADKLRQSRFWSYRPRDEYWKQERRGEVWKKFEVYGVPTLGRAFVDEVAGEIPWRTLHVETTAT